MRFAFKASAPAALVLSIALGVFSAKAADTTAPDITCGEDKSAEAREDWAFDIPTAKDVVDTNNVLIEAVSTVTNILSPKCPGLFSVTRTWRVTDTSSNSAFCSQTLTIVDTQPPDLRCGPDKHVECGAFWAFDIPTAVDVNDLNNVLIEVVATVTNAALPRCPKTFSVTRTWRATDTCGNASFGNQTVTVVDLEPPELICHKDKFAPPVPIWMFDNPSAVDNCDLTNVLIEVVATVTNSLPPGGPALFSVTRFWRTTDTCGNSAFCNQTVTVITNPVLDCRENIIAECAGGLTPVTFSVTAVDASGAPVSVTCVPPSGTGFRVGTSNVVCTAIDGQGRSNSCSFTVTVQDTMPPIVTCPSNITAQATSAAGAVVTYTAGAFDPCGIAAFACVPSGGTTFPVGTTTVTCAAVDSSHNTNSCSFNITVSVPNTPPVASNDVVMTLPNTAVNFNVLTNDSDADGDTLTVLYAFLATPIHGQLTIAVDGTTTYTPDPGFVGTVSFEYTISDGHPAGTNHATVTITVIDTSPACLLAWKFDEASGLTVLDSSGNNILGRLTNGPVRTNGVLGRAVRFDGSNDRVQATNASSLNVTVAFTVACWVRPESVSDYQYFLIKGNDADERFAYALRSANAKVEYRWVNPAGIQSAFRTTTNVLAIGRWTHVAVAHAPGSAPMIFINGVAVPSSIRDDGGSASYLLGTSPNPFCVGAAADNVDKFKGTIDEVFVCATKLTAGQIRNLTNGLPPGPPPPPSAVGIATASPLPGGAVGAAYSQTLTATGGTPGFTWSLVSGALPGGLVLNTNTGVIAGTPTTATTNTFRILVRDTLAQVAEKDFVLAVTLAPSAATGCLVHWKFDEASGLVALDSTGNNNLGALLNGPIRTNGQVNRALRFDGSNDRVQASNGTSLNVTGALTVAVWVKPENTDSRYLLIKGDDDDDDFAYALRTSSGKVRYLWVDPSGNVNKFQTTPVVLAVGRWTHITVVHTPGRAPVLYTNGVVVPSARQDGSTTALRGTSSRPFTVGGSADATDHFKGALDEVVVCTGALTATEIQSLMTGTLPGMAPMAPSPLPLPFTGYGTAPLACTLRVADGLATISWPATPGQTYRVQFKDSLTDESWQDLSGEIFVPSEAASVDDPVSDRPQRFYRVVQGP